MQKNLIYFSAPQVTSPPLPPHAPVSFNCQYFLDLESCLHLNNTSSTSQWGFQKILFLLSFRLGSWGYTDRSLLSRSMEQSIQSQIVHRVYGMLWLLTECEGIISYSGGCDGYHENERDKLTRTADWQNIENRKMKRRRYWGHEIAERVNKWVPWEDGEESHKMKR